MVDRVQYQVLGELSARSGRETVALGGPRQKLALALLLIEPGVTVSIDRLIEGVWDDQPPSRARHTLQAYMSELRRVLADPIEWAGNGYRVEIDPQRVDARHFEALVDQGRSQLDDNPQAAAALIKEGLDLWRGEPFSDLAYAEALQAEIRRLNQLRLSAIEDRIRADLAAGRHRLVVEELEVLTHEHPLREGLAAQYMLALYRDGRQAEALRVYARTRALLIQELGIEPSTSLQDLEERILQQDETLLLPEDLEHVAPRSARGYEIREEIHRSATGAVFRAYQASMGREVALKKMPPSTSNDADFVRRFEAYAQRVAALEHPHIVSLFDYWRDSTGTYLVMPWLEGGSLADRLEGGPLTVSAAMRTLDTVGSAVAYAHRADVYHGSITARNVLFDGDGNAYLADFLEAAGKTQAVEPPDATVAGDVFQLGALAHVMLSGSRPSAGSRVRLTDLRDDVSVAIGDVIFRAIATQPGDRYRRVDDFLRDLRRAAGSDVIAVAGREPSSVPARNPYKGLRAFQEMDADDFFGREDTILTLVDALRSHRLVAVAGPSGSGKSSLVRAGLLPAVRGGAVEGSERWLITDMFPGEYPFDELATALRRVAVEPTDDLREELAGDEEGLIRAAKRILPAGGTSLLLVIDQFEELFSMVDDRGTRQQFLDVLIAAAGDTSARIRTVVTIRADFYDRPLEYQRFGELIKKGLVSITAPSRDGLARAVSGPARRVGLDLEPGLVDEIVRDVEDQPGGLPLLQHALSELFEHREHTRLTVEGYRRTGGVKAALGRRAEELYQSLTEPEKKAAEEIFMRMVTVDETSSDARRRVRRSELADLDVSPAVLDSILLRFGGFRLLSFDRDPVTRGATVEVAHEAVLREWERLREWIDGRRQDLLVRRRLQEAHREWGASGRDAAFLLAGGRLEFFEGWSADASLTLTRGEGEFLSFSRLEEDEQQRRRRRRRRAIFSSFAAAAIVAIVLGTVAILQRERAEAGERAAELRALMSAAIGSIEIDPDLALLLAAEAVESSREGDEDVSWDALEAIHRVLLSTAETKVLDGGGRVVFSPTGGFLVTHGQDPLGPDSQVWDTTTWEKVGSLIGSGDAAGLAVSGDGRFIVTTHLDGQSTVWDSATLERVTELGDHPTGYFRPQLSSDGEFLVVSQLVFGPENPTVIEAWDVDTGQELWRGEFPDGGTWFTELSPDDTRLAVIEPATGMIKVYDTDGWTEQFAIEDSAADLLFTPDSSQLITGGSRIRVWDATDGSEIREIPAPHDPIFRMALSPDGDLLAVAGPTSDVLVLDVESGDILGTLSARQINIESLSFSSDGRYLASTINDEGRALVTEIWDVASSVSGVGVEVMNYFADSGTSITHATWNADRSQVLATFFYQDLPVVGEGEPPNGGGTWIFDAETGEVQERYDGEFFGQWHARAIPSPDGRYIAVTDRQGGGQTGTTRIIDAESLEAVARLEPGGVPHEFSDDSSLLYIGDINRGYVYETVTWELVTTLEDNAADVFVDGRFLTDGMHLITAGFGLRPGAGVWSLESGSVVRTALRDLFPLGISTSADGSLVSVMAGTGVGIFREQDLLDGEAEEVEAAYLVEGVTPLFARLSPDGSMLVTGGFDEHLSFYEVATGELLYRVDMGAVLSDAVFSEDGSRLLVAADAGVTHLLALHPDELVVLARGRAARELTDDECQFYLQLEACPTG